MSRFKCSSNTNRCVVGFYHPSCAVSQPANNLKPVGIFPPTTTHNKPSPDSTVNPLCSKVTHIFRVHLGLVNEDGWCSIAFAVSIVGVCVCLCERVCVCEVISILKQDHTPLHIWIALVV